MLSKRLSFLSVLALLQRALFQCDRDSKLAYLQSSIPRMPPLSTTWF
jgi:hypothetical protein